MKHMSSAAPDDVSPIIFMQAPSRPFVPSDAHGTLIVLLTAWCADALAVRGDRLQPPRQATIKRRYDPATLFHSNASVLSADGPPGPRVTGDGAIGCWGGGVRHVPLRVTDNARMHSPTTADPYHPITL
jgi:hypothetical protein